MKFYAKARIYWQILAHHLLAVFLVYLSFVVGFQYYGLAILLLYDSTELPAYLTQFNRELKKTKFVNISAVILALSWIVTWFIYRVIAPIKEVVMKGMELRNTRCFQENFLAA